VATVATAPLTELPRRPVTSGIAVLAIGSTIAWMVGWDIDALTIDVRALHGEPWRLWTSALPHVGAVHLLFNAYWLWRFGARVEARYGHLATLAMLGGFAAVSAVAEYALFDGGVGLSGVGYGLLGLLMIVHRRDPELADTVDLRTIGLFTIWFGICILTTVSGVMPVANVAHAAGWLAGLGLGLAITGHPVRRASATAACIALAIASWLGASVWRPAINLSHNAGQTSAWLGAKALDDGDPNAAVDHYTRALSLNERGAWRYNYGLALWEVGDREGATRALERAVELEPTDQHRAALEAARSGTLRVSTRADVDSGSGSAVAD
jgi:membrane associated rhomboid family serine protease